MFILSDESCVNLTRHTTHSFSFLLVAVVDRFVVGLKRAPKKCFCHASLHSFMRKDTFFYSENVFISLYFNCVSHLFFDLL